MTETIPLDDNPDAAARVIDTLRSGGLAVVPTDTVYGIVTDAFRPDSTRRIAEVKQRSTTTPLSILIRSPRQVAGLVADVSDAAERLMASYWPGPLTLVFDAADGLSWDLGDTQGTVALRIPADDLLLAVIAEIGPLASTGAGRRGHAAPTSVADAHADLGEDVDLFVDGGHRRTAASTVVAVTTGAAVVLREGAIPASDIEQVASGAVAWGARPDAAATTPPGAAGGAVPLEEGSIPPAGDEVRAADDGATTAEDA